MISCSGLVSEAAATPGVPFFIYLAYQATHAPLQAPPDVVASFAHVQDPSRRTFAAMAAVVDEGVGNITDALMRSGAHSNTVVHATLTHETTPYIHATLTHVYCTCRSHLCMYGVVSLPSCVLQQNIVKMFRIMWKFMKKISNDGEQACLG